MTQNLDFDLHAFINFDSIVEYGGIKTTKPFEALFFGIYDFLRGRFLGFFPDGVLRELQQMDSSLHDVNFR